MTSDIWELSQGDLPLVATAVHDGHEVRAELEPLFALPEADRLREEDPYTGGWTEIAPTRIVARRSRFEVDLNRPRESAVYREPEDAWGLHVWKQPLPEAQVATSLAEYDSFYEMLANVCDTLGRKHEKFVVFDLHSYNHRRAGPQGPVADARDNPQVNIGTGTMTDRAAWAPVIERFIGDLSAFDFPGGALDVRENVKFRGGNCARWIHANYAGSACVLSIEFKKFFMDEWSGAPDKESLDAISHALRTTVPGVLEELRGL